MRDPHGDDSSGGWETGRSNALGRQEGDDTQPVNGGGDDAAAREADIKAANAWIKGGKTTDSEM